MGFENPGSFAWAALAAVLAAFYLWRSAGRPQEVATFHLWQRALARRPAWVGLRFWLSLTAQIVALLLLVLALTQPYWSSGATSERSLVLILDVSAGMAATDVPPSRFDAMRERAEQMIDDLRRGDRLAILAAGDGIRTLGRLGESPAALRAACEALALTDGPPRVAEAVEMARLMLQDQPNPQIIVLTGGGFPEAAELAVTPDVHLVLLGDAPRNAAITRLAARPLESDPGRFAVLVEVANNGVQPVTAPLEIGLRDGERQVVQLDLAPGNRVRHVFGFETEGPSQLEAVLRSDDDLSADNRAVLPLAGRPPVTVRLVAEPSEVATQIEAALASIPGVAVELLAGWPATLEARDAGDGRGQEMPPVRESDSAIHVFHRLVPERMPPGGAIVLDPQSGGDLWERASSVSGPIAAEPSDGETSLLNGVEVADIVFEEAARLEYRVPAEPLVVSDAGQPLYSLLERPEGPVLVWHAGLEREHSDLILRDDFPRLLRNAVERLAGPAASMAYVRLPDRPETLVPAAVSGKLPLADAARVPPLWMLPVAAAALLLALEACLFHRRITV